MLPLPCLEPFRQYDNGAHKGITLNVTLKKMRKNVPSVNATSATTD